MLYPAPSARRLARLVAMLLVLLAPSASAAGSGALSVLESVPEPVVLPLGAGRLDLAPRAAVLIDDTGADSIEAVAALPRERFAALGLASGPVPPTDSTVPRWFLVELSNGMSGPVPVVLDIRRQTIAEIGVYLETDDGWVSGRGGLVESPAGRDFQVPSNAFALEIPPGDHRLFLRVRGGVNVPLELFDPATFVEFNQWYALASGAFSGLGIGLLMFNGFLFLRTRDRLYLAFLVLLGTHVVFRAFSEGFGQLLIPGQAGLIGSLFATSFLAYIGSTLLFHDEFLDLSRAAPRQHYFFRAATVVFYVGAICAFFRPTEVIGVLLLPVALSSWMLLASGLFQSYRGLRPARIYTGALCFPILTGAARSLESLGVVDLPAGFHVIDNSAGTLAVLVFAIATAERIAQMREEKQRAEQAAISAEVAARARSDFLARMSHEIRTPMNGVLGMSDLLAETSLSSEQMRYVRTISASGSTLVHVINDLLDFSKLEAGKLEIERIPFDPRALLRETADVFRLGHQRDGIELDVFVADAVPIYVTGDPYRLRQVLTNLLGNAFKFTESGTIRVAMAPGEDLGTLHMVVSDSGIGIAPDDQEGLFDAFTQATRETTRKYGGTGLGLSISRELVTLMGGRIWVESELGHGANFHVVCRLPRCPAEDFRAAQGKQLDVDHVEPMFVLVVDDNEINRRVAGGHLEKLGHSLIMAKDGAEGLAKAQLHHDDLDLVLMDWEMPELDGPAATRGLRTWEASTERVNLFWTAIEKSA